MVGQCCERLELVVVACSGGELKGGDGLGVPSMLDTVFPPMELSKVRKEGPLVLFVCGSVERDGVGGDFLQSDASDGAHLRAEVIFEQALAQADALEDFRTAVAADGGDAHLRHDLEQAFLHRLDVVLLSRGIFFLDFVTFHQVVEYGEGHVGAEGGSAISQQQCSVHRLADFSRLHDQRSLHALAYGYQVVMHCADGKQAGDGCVCGVHVAVGEDDVVVPFVH